MILFLGKKTSSSARKIIKFEEKTNLKLWKNTVKDVTKERNTILALKMIKTYENEGKKSSDVYRHKLGLGSKQIKDNVIENDNDSPNKVSVDNTLDTQEVNPISRIGTLDRAESPEMSELFPRIGDRSHTVSSKRSGDISRNYKGNKVASKQHQAYSILKLKSMKKSPRAGRKVAQSRIESYHRQPLTTFDHVDDEIVDQGIFDIKSTRAK